MKCGINPGCADAIAIVGMAFRFPGDLGDESAFWSALTAGRDLVGAIGGDRWAVDALAHPRRSEPGRSVTFSAGVLSRVDEFDAQFFGISPREAAWLDPQQRLLLELAWEAMENGGQVPAHLAGSDCAVYVGISGLDYGMRGLDDLPGMTGHSMTGNTLSIAANRLSYVFDLHGPSMAVDTACSSSLVALHQACRTLATGESSMALVGGINILLHPYPFIGFTKASMLSAQGRCRAFDASGDGYVRAEGGAVLVLKPLAAAEAAGDPIHAVILASGVNADGARKTGITIPSPAGQAELMRTVLKRSGLVAAAIDYVEAHGTGTAVGDPVEARAIGEVYGQGRPRPLPIGSVKSNLGHLEPASGMAGLVKTVLMLKHKAIPPTVHLQTPNPNIDFNGLNLEVPTALRPLETGNAASVMAVNSFGFGGANAHVIVRAHIPPSEVARQVATPAPLVFSARTDAALRALAAEYSALLARAGDRYYDLAHTAAFRRQFLERRLAVNGLPGPQMAALLDQVAAGENPAGAYLEDAPAEAGEVALVYSGNGSQWPGMARRLLDDSPRFAELMGELDEAMALCVGFSVVAELREGDAARMADTAVAQPLLFAVQVALTRMLRDRGIKARCFVGHSVGEVAAAWAAGALDLEQAIAVIAARSAAQAKTRGAGRMAALGLGAEEARAFLAECGLAHLEIAGINAPAGVTLAGPLVQLEVLGVQAKARNIFFRLLDLDYAFHSRAMDPVRGELAAALEGLAPKQCSGTFVSTVSGGALPGESLGAAYWWDNIRQPVQFASAVRHLADLGCRIFIEIGPHPVLQRYVGECLSAVRCPGRVLATLRRDDDGEHRVDEAALRAHLAAREPDLGAYFPHPGRFLPLPVYPWQRERHWHPQSAEANRLIERCRIHPLLGWRIKDHPAAWENVLDLETHPTLKDHRVGGAVVLAGAAYVEMALAAGREVHGSDSLELEELDIVAPVVFDSDHGRSTRCELQPREGFFRIFSRPRLSDEEWTLNASGRLFGVPCSAPASIAAGAFPNEPVDPADHYRLAKALELDYGPAFRSFAGGCRSGEVLDGRLSTGGESACLIDPAALDGCFQALVHFFRADIEAGRGLPLLPVKVGRLRLWASARPAAFRLVLRRRSARSVEADIVLLGEDGGVLALLERCRFRAATLRGGAAQRPALWQTIAKVLPHPAAIPVPADSRELACRIRDGLAALELDGHRHDYFAAGQPLLEALAVSFAYAAMAGLAAEDDGRIGRWIAEPELSGAVVAPMFLYLVGRLQEAGLLTDEGGTWQLQTRAAPPPPEDIWRTLVAEFPEMLPELLFVGRAGRQLPEFLRGTGIGVVGPAAPLEAYLNRSPAFLGLRQALGDLLAIQAADLAPGSRLRVLEVCQIASDLPHRLAALPNRDRVDYVIAASDPNVLAHLEGEYGRQPGVSVAALADGALLARVGEVPEQFDLVVAYHWLHRNADLPAAVAGLRSRLAPGGLLAVAERPADTTADLFFGREPGWWHPHGQGFVSSLLGLPEWMELLHRGGFDDAVAVQEPAAGEGGASPFLVLAGRAATPLVEDVPAVARWLFVVPPRTDGFDLTDAVVARLESRGQSVRVLRRDLDFTAGDSTDVFAALSGATAALGGVDHLVYLATLGGNERPSLEDLPVVDDLGCNGVLHAVHALAGGDLGSARLWLVTSGGALLAQGGADWLVDPAQSGIWGFGRVVMNEYPALGCTLIDLACASRVPEAASRLADEFLCPDGESEIVLAADGRHVVRLQSVTAAVLPAEEEPRFRLDFAVPGRLRNLAWIPAAEQALPPDGIEVQPLAAGLNFRDVMYAMGLLPDEAVESGFAGASLGLEFSGTISRVGSDPGDFRVGDEVMGFGAACFASHVVTRRDAIARKPADWSHAQAATVPTVFFTVYYALKHLAQVRPGERVLIHGGAGGVGIAAIQLARHLGAEIYATAGNDEKRDFVSLLGADRVFDSRSLEFADQILVATGGEGVDVVLNSLAGEAINRNLKVLRPFGRFLELGKRDFYENTVIGLRPFKDNISYFGIDADQLLVARPVLAAELFAEVMALFRDGVLAPLPYRLFAADQVVDAFRTMQQSRQIGKVVVALDGPPKTLAEVGRPAVSLRLEADSTWLVTGGLSGFGLATATWLVEHGLGSLVLIGRRGAATPGAADAVAALEARGARVRVEACDIADEEALARVIASIERDLPPLKGVVHAAMVLDDALIANLDAGRLRRAIEPKVAGARNLHRLTLGLPLDHFVLYSSVTTVLGNPGQANYVAANAYLESLTALRRARGLPATCIGWGPLGDVGYLTRQTELRDSLASRLGAEPLTAEAALRELETALLGQAGMVTVADFEWQALARLMPSAQGPRFEFLARRAGGFESSSQEGGDLRALLAGKSPQEAVRIIQDLVRAEVAPILGIAADRIDPGRSLFDLGMDSLMAVELAMGIERRFGVNLPAMALTAEPTPERIAAKIADLVANGEDTSDGEGIETLVQQVAAQHAESFTAEDLARTVADVKLEATTGARLIP